MEQALRIVLTPGEPAGIGPDLIVKLAQRARRDRWIVVADPQLLTERAGMLGLPLQTVPIDEQAGENFPCDPGTIEVLPVSLRMPAIAGTLDAGNADYVLETLALACDGCLDGRFDALVTGPVHKGVINDAGTHFTGHTEFFAQRCQADPVMMLATADLRVALVTTHLPLSQVSAAITPAHLQRVIELLHRDLSQRFGIASPRILVCGLNPHAGEGGHLGTEEIEVIEPVLEQLRTRGWELIGPLPADTAFVPERLRQVDVVLAMYHDQGLPVLKHHGFGRAVNVTLGLPIIRTSVDHGTALDLAGTGRCREDSLDEALAMATRMAQAQKRKLSHAG